MTQKISQHIIEYTLGSVPHDVNITEISRQLGMNTSTLWFKVAGSRKWDVETWLDLLCVMGALKVEEGKITIRTHIPDSHIARFKKLYKKYPEMQRLKG
jgi:hypothetical protein